MNWRHLPSMLFKRFVRRNRHVTFPHQNPAYRKYPIGEWTYGNPIVLTWGDDAELRIGNFCSIADDVKILLGGEHRSDWITTYPFNRIFPEGVGISGHPTSKGQVNIGSDVWIGQGATILSGVTIGDGAVVGAESLVAKAVEPYEVVAGNPARHIRYRFSEPVRQTLLRIAWWNWPLDKIREAMPVLLSNDVSRLVELSGQGDARPDPGPYLHPAENKTS